MLELTRCKSRYNKPKSFLPPLISCLIVISTSVDKIIIYIFFFLAKKTYIVFLLQCEPNLKLSSENHHIYTGQYQKKRLLNVVSLQKFYFHFWFIFTQIQVVTFQYTHIFFYYLKSQCFCCRTVFAWSCMVYFLYNNVGMYFLYYALQYHFDWLPNLVALHSR